MTKKKFITCDGNQAAAHISYIFSESAAIYPITPSSTMAEHVDEWAANGRKNMFGQVIKVDEMQSEGGAAAAMHGSLQAGALSTTYTASQGLLLMIPNMYKMAGELLPGVFHVSARALAAQALSIFGDHQDIYAARQTGFAMLATSSVQEIMDIAGVAHLAAIKSRVPFLHFFDGFRTSHEIQKIEEIDAEKLSGLVDQDALQEFRKRALNPEHPVTRGTAQNPDIYFQTREASQPFYNDVPQIVEDYFREIEKITGRRYELFDFYGAEDATELIIAMGSVCDTIKEVIDYKNANGEKVALINVHLFRPFSVDHFLKAIPTTVKTVAVLDRTKEPGASGEPLYLDVRNALYGKPGAPKVVGGRYGLSSKDTTPAQIIAVYDNLKQEEPKNNFTIGIVDDVTHTSLLTGENVKVAPEGTYSAKFYGLGSDGTVGANKNSIKIIGNSTDKYAQAYFAYDSKKSGGITISHLRFGDEPIRSSYLVINPDFVACHSPSYINKYDMLKGLKKGGTFLMNSIWSKEETIAKLPDHMKFYFAANDIKVYIINATKLAIEVGLRNRTNTIMQAAFFKISNVIPEDLAEEQMKAAIKKTFGKKGDEVVNMNYAGVEKGLQEVEQIEVPKEWLNLEPHIKIDGAYDGATDFVKNIVTPINSLEGDSLPVSAFKGYEDGTFPNGTTEFEKRGVAPAVASWHSEYCIQCNQCAIVCPHACIRPFLLNDEDVKGLPEGTPTLDAKGKAFKEHQYRIQISPLDCTGCGDCVQVCPSNGKGDALTIESVGSQEPQQGIWDYLVKETEVKDTLDDKFKNVKNSQFAQPLFEFSGACAGCGETPYVKLVTQLFGDRMVIANATGCSSIYGGSAPSTSYTTNKEGKGPAWANSLFEDNAEFGYGIAQGIETIRDRVEAMLVENKSQFAAETQEIIDEWTAGRNIAAQSELASKKLVPALEKETSEIAKEILSLSDYFIKKSVWIFGGDGWAYDIGYGGLDHVIASGKDVNILVLDTEIYSNTGGQSSKSTPIAAIAKFAASGKRIRKKDLGKIAMGYGYVYVAQISMGANQAQTLKAIREAEAYPGPSIVIAYSPCISHGIKGGMANTQLRMKNAVESGYWWTYRYNPMLEDEGKNPLVIDSKAPKWELFQDFLNQEVRYTSLTKSFPEQANELFKAAEEDAKWRYKSIINFQKALEPEKEEE